MEYLIRQANSKDASAIAKIKVETWQAHYRGQIADDYLDKLSVEKLTKKWQERLDDKKSRTAIFVAESDGGIIGFCWVGPANDEVNNTGEVYAIYLAQNKQGRGIGSDLMKTGLDYLRKKAFKKQSCGF